MRSGLRIAISAVALFGLCAYAPPNKQFHIADAKGLSRAERGLTNALVRDKSSVR